MSIEDITYEYFKKYKREISIEELIKEFKINPTEIDFLLNILYELEKKGKIYFNEEDKKYIYIPKEFLYHFGVVTKAKSNNYIIKQNDGTNVIFKNNNNLKPGDAIFYTTKPTKHPKTFNGIIIRIITKEFPNINYSFIVKEELKKDNSIYYINYNKKRIIIDKEKLNNALVGDIVSVNIYNNNGNIVEILERKQKDHIFRVVKDKCIPINGCYGSFYPNEYVEDNSIVLGEVTTTNKIKIIRKLENLYSLKEQIDELIDEYGFKKEFPDDVLKQVNKINEEIPEAELRNRRDLRNLETLTIDPITAKDLDDAISLEYDDDKYILYVHTANPSHYIKFGSPLYKEALRRCFSIYPSDDVIPMLPSKLSNGVCSLNEEGDKLALTIKIEFDKKGNIIDTDVFKSIIHNNKKMDYDSVNQFLISKDKEEYKPFLNTLLKMEELSNILEDKKQKRGAISFDNIEEEIIVNSDGSPIELKEENRGVAQKIIENFMLTANESIARYANNLDLPFIYRNHEKPSLEKAINLKIELRSKGYILSKLKNIDNPTTFQKLLTKIIKGKSEEEKKIICEIALKSMSRANYSNKNTGHYGLALDCYATFTSPARKISDLINHMIIEYAIDSNYSNNYDKINEYITSICDYISSRQEAADKLELEINNLMLNCYAVSFIDVELDAKVLFVNSYGIYIKTNNKLNGVIPFDKNITNIYNNRGYKNNSTIKVKLTKIDNGELIFTISKEKNKVLKKIINNN